MSTQRQSKNYLPGGGLEYAETDREKLITYAHSLQAELTLREAVGKNSSDIPFGSVLYVLMNIAIGLQAEIEGVLHPDVARLKGAKGRLDEKVQLAKEKELNGLAEAFEKISLGLGMLEFDWQQDEVIEQLRRDMRSLLNRLG